MNRKYKIAIYTISKNESKFVDRFMDCLENEADLILVADTGSTDDTVEKLKSRGAVVHKIKVDPWRFDIARNISMHLLPNDIDICVCIDLDEVLSQGWRNEIEKVWTDKTTRLRYQYYWSVNDDGSPGVSYWYDKIHSRNGYLWKHPVHETLHIQNGFVEHQTFCDSFILKHYPDQSKSRSSYLPLLELSVKEDPNNDRNSHYLGREYMFYGQYDNAIKELQRHLSLSSSIWNQERCASNRFIGRCFEYKNNLTEANKWFLKALLEDNESREPWFELAKNYYKLGDFVGCYFAIDKTLSINERPKTYICEPAAWGYEVYDYGSISAWSIGLKDVAIKYASESLLLLQKNNLTKTKDYIRIKENLQKMQ